MPLTKRQGLDHHSTIMLNDVTKQSGTSTASPKVVLLTQLAAVAKAVAHPHRLALLEQLAQGERSVEVLADRTQAPLPNTSQHLQQMRRLGLVAVRRQGKFVFYRLADDAVVEFLALLRQIAQRNLAEVDKLMRSYFHERDSLEPVSRAELVKRMRLGVVTVLDVRPEDEFALGHVRGAVNIPLRALKQRLAGLNRKHEIVAYCRGPNCVLSYEAVALLRDRGFRAFRLEDGLPEWRIAGLPVERDSPQQFPRRKQGVR